MSDDCIYCGGDPRIDDRIARGKLLLHPNEIKLEWDGHSVHWPRNSIENIYYQPVAPIQIEADSGIRLNTDSWTEITSCIPSITLVVRDPEGVYANGFRIQFVFEKEYAARVFAKQAASAFNLESSQGDNS